MPYVTFQRSACLYYYIVVVNIGTLNYGYHLHNFPPLHLRGSGINTQTTRSALRSNPLSLC